MHILKTIHSILLIIALALSSTPFSWAQEPSIQGSHQKPENGFSVADVSARNQNTQNLVDAKNCLLLEMNDAPSADKEIKRFLKLSDFRFNFTAEYLSDGHSPNTYSIQKSGSKVTIQIHSYFRTTNTSIYTYSIDFNTLEIKQRTDYVHGNYFIERTSVDTSSQNWRIDLDKLIQYEKVCENLNVHSFQTKTLTRLNSALTAVKDRASHPALPNFNVYVISSTGVTHTFVKNYDRVYVDSYRLDLNTLEVDLYSRYSPEMPHQKGSEGWTLRIQAMISRVQIGLSNTTDLDVQRNLRETLDYLNCILSHYRYRTPDITPRPLPRAVRSW